MNSTCFFKQILHCVTFFSGPSSTTRFFPLLLLASPLFYYSLPLSSTTRFPSLPLLASPLFHYSHPLSSTTRFLFLIPAQGLSLHSCRKSSIKHSSPNKKVNHLYARLAKKSPRRTIQPLNHCWSGGYPWERFMVSRSPVSGSGRGRCPEEGRGCPQRSRLRTSRSRHQTLPALSTAIHGDLGFKRAPSSGATAAATAGWRWRAGEERGRCTTIIQFPARTPLTPRSV